MVHTVYSEFRDASHNQHAVRVPTPALLQDLESFFSSDDMLGRDPRLTMSGSHQVIQDRFVQNMGHDRHRLLSRAPDLSPET